MTEQHGWDVSKRMPMGEAALHAALLRLRRDAPGLVARWSLGGRGVFELDAIFAGDGPDHSTSGRLWDAPGVTMARVTVSVTADGDQGRLTLRPDATLPEPWARDRTAWLAVARAAVVELAEELRWHASRITAVDA